MRVRSSKFGSLLSSLLAAAPLLLLVVVTNDNNCRCCITAFPITTSQPTIRPTTIAQQQPLQQSSYPSITSSSLLISAQRGRRTARRSKTTQLQLASSSAGSALKNGDTVVVIGGTSGVGQLVTRKLAASGNGYSVKVTSRDPTRARSIAGDGVDVCEVDLVDTTKVDAQLENALKGATAVVVSVGTTAFPTIRWRGGNTPSAIDKEAVTRIAQACSKTGTVKKVVLVTSVGVDRTKEMPFLILNLFGVLDAKKDGEQAIMENSSGNYDYVIVRPGRLVGGPFTNLDVAKLLQIEGGSENGIDLAKGDALLGDAKRDAVAETIVQILMQDKAANIDFSIVSNEEKNPYTTSEQWNAAFQKLL